MKGFLINKKINLKSTFIKLILSYIILTSLILSITTTVLYNSYKNQLIENSIGSSEKTLNQAIYYTDYILNWSKLFLYQLYLNEDIYSLMYYGKNNYYSSNENSKILQLNFPLPSIHSVYVYNNNSGKVYSSISETVDINNFYDKGLLPLISDSPDGFSTGLTPRKVSFLSKDNLKYDRNILSITFSNTKNSKNNLPDGAIILNLSVDEIEKYFKTISKDKCDIFAIDNTGNIIFHSNSSMFLKNVSSLEYVKTILNEHNSKGSFLSDINGEPCVISYNSSDKLGLKLIAVAPYHTLLGSMEEMNHLMLIIFISLLFIGIIVSYFISKKIYSPIGRIVKDVENKIIKHNLIGEIQSNEFDFLSLAIDSVFNENISLKKLSFEDRKFLRNRLIESLLLNNLTNFKDIKERLDELSIKVSEGTNLVILFKIDQISEFYSKYSHEDRKLLRFGICNICQDVSSKAYNSECISIGKKHISLILNTSDRGSLDNLDLVENLIKEIQNYVMLFYNISLSAAIGCCADNLYKISTSYEVAMNYLNYTLKFGSGSILNYDKIILNLNSEYQYPDEIENALFSAVKLANIKNMEKELDRILEKISSYSYSNMLLGISQLALHSKKLIDTLYNINNESSNINLKSFLNNLDKLETFTEVKSWFIDLYTSSITQLDEKKSNKKNDIIKNTIAYINENYNNPNLSVDIISDYVNISSSYLRAIFKTTENKSLSTYISELRFNKAKVLLETTSLTVSEISTEVGFSNSNYFYTAFKKKYGISPNQYRNTFKIRG
ncbi:AraC family transcriptional regulator [Clostridium sp. CX1]|uniref:AraC family transcriptional regulator n=1 Tax=Clostridium sp. CX1 TaxID=2978346 RepID=UPI0021BEC202|nr:AraC family transcriptional regulator [Clostridium sp. CX1]MCT8978179.1 AraC family transcriptional regulator [Clostridium sp. CX1]